MNSSNPHIALLGDSIFDNGVYVPGEATVIDQFRAEMRSSWRATLLAVDGDTTADMEAQLDQLPNDATHLVISVGGNDALGQAHLLDQTKSEDDLVGLLEEVLPAFERRYQSMINVAQSHAKPIVVCTIYDQCPFPDPTWRELVPVAIGRFNDVIMSVASKNNLRMIELRDICTHKEDFSHLSPIEPSVIGGMKIVQAIIEELTR